MRKVLLVLALVVFAAGIGYAAAGDAVVIGTADAWKNTLAVAYNDCKLYSVNAKGCLFVTDLLKGKSTQIGSDRFSSTRWLLATEDLLCSIERGGSFYTISPASGDMKLVGAPGTWKDTIAAFVLAGQCFSADVSGPLYVTTLKTGKYKQIGSASFARCRTMLVSVDSILSFETGGTLFAAPLADGAKRQVGAVGQWKLTRAACVAGGTVWSVEEGGALIATDLATGNRTPTGKGGLATVRHLVAFGDNLFALGEDGTLSRIALK